MTYVPPRPRMAAAPPQATSPDAAGVRAAPRQRFGEYELFETLGRGAATVVQRARHVQHGDADLALKIAAKAAPEDLARTAGEFLREAALLASIGHASLPTIHEVGEVDGQPFIAMERVEGRSLATLLRDRPLTEAALLAAAIDVAEVLSAMHRHGAVHRDIKPDNLLVTPDGRTRVIDVGLAAWTADGSDVSGTLAGTFVYSAPEQTGMFARAVDGRADLYSLGVVLFECAAGTPPFNADDVGELLHLHATQAPPDLRQLRPELSSPLAELIVRLLAKDADDRVASADALLGELRALRDGTRSPRPATGSGTGSWREATALGRLPELERLRARWQHIGRGGTFALVTGASGSGRDALVRTLAAEIRARGGAAVVAACTQDPTPLAPLRSALLSHLQSVGCLPPNERDEATRRLRAAVGETGDLLRGLVPSLAETLQPGSAAHPPEAGAAVREEDIILAVVDLLRGIAREEGGLLLALTDTQWLDPLSRRVMRQLASCVADVPLLVAVTVREDEHAVLAVIRDEVGEELGLSIELAPLGPADAATVVASQLAGAEVPDALTASIVARTGGNPAAIVEFVRALVDGGAVRPHWGRWELDVAALDRLRLPADVRDLLLARLDRFDDAARRLLTTAAVQGARFERDLLVAVAGDDASDVSAAIAAAEAARLIERSGAGHIFVHEDVRERLLQGADPAWVAGVHAALAAALAARPATDDGLLAIARHRVASGDATDARATFEACLAAAEDSLARRLVSEAADLLDHALRAATRAGTSPDAAFHHTYAQAAFLVGRFARAREHLQLALADIADPVDRARALETLARIQTADHDTEGALVTVRRGLLVLGRPLPRTTFALLITSFLRLWGGWRRLKKRRLPSDAEQQVLDAMEVSLLGVGAGAAAGSLRNGLVAALDARALLPASRLPAGELRATAIAGMALVLHYVRRPRFAARMFEVALQSAQVVRSRRAVAAVCVLRGVAESRDGDPAALAGQLEKHGRWLDVGDYLPWVILAASMYHADGHALEAERWLAQARLRADDDPSPTDEAARVLMEVANLALLGRGAQADLMYERLRAARESTSPTRDTQLFYSWVELSLANEREEVGEPVDRALARLESFGLPIGNVTAGWARLSMAVALVARAATRDGDEQRTLLRRAGRELRLASINASPKLSAMIDTIQARRAHLRGRHRTNARLLDRASRNARELDQPAVLYDVALQRARTLQADGHHAGARRQACVALALAIEGHWEARAARVRTEFELQEEFQIGRRGTQRPSVDGSSRQLDHLQAVRRLEALQEVSAAAVTVLDPDQVTESALEVVLRLLSAERAFIFAVDPEREGVLVPNRGRDAEGNAIAELHGYSRTLVERVHAGGEPVIVTGTEEGEALGSRSAVVHGLRSILVAPIEVHGRRTGVIYLDSRVAKGIFTRDDLGLLATLAAQVAASQETARAAQLEAHVHAARRQRDLADDLRCSMEHLTASLDPDEVLRRSLTLAVNASGSERGCLVREGADGWEVTALAERSGDGVVEIVALGPALGSPVVPDLQHILDSVRPAIGSASGPEAGRFPSRLAEFLDGPRSWLTVPLRADDVLLGVVVLGSARYAAYDEVTVGIAATLTEQALAAHQTASLFAQVEQLATRDTLTGLANRGHFWHLAERYLEGPGEPCGTAIMLDIDHFKQVNDTHGHAAGDAVLREVAARLVGELGDDDLIGRYGGEEFAALLPGCTDGLALAERLRAAVGASPVVTEAGDIPVTISVGISLLRTDGDLDEALVRADAALYRAKRAGRDRVGTDGAPAGAGASPRSA